MMKNHIFFLFHILSILFFVFTINSSADENINIYLKPGIYINSGHPEIIEKAKEITKSCKTDVERAKLLYEYVRDMKRVNDADKNFYEDDSALGILKTGDNSCFGRSLLLAAFCRAVGIPARLHLQKCMLKNWKYPDDTVGDNKFAHGIAGIYLNGAWHHYETVANKEKWGAWTQDKARADEMPIEFDPDRDCLFKNDDKVICETLPVHFADWSSEVIQEIRKVDGGKYLSPELQQGKNINSDHPDIINKAGELTKNCTTDVEKAKALYEYVRDSNNDNECNTFKASEILKCGGNLCYERAVLLAALCRAAGIPARLCLQIVTLKKWKKEDGTIIEGSFAHGITGIKLKNEWHLYEAVGNPEKWIIWTQDKTRGSEMPILFHADRNCLFPYDDKIVLEENIPKAFNDWTEEVEKEIEKVNSRPKKIIK
jgi:transglutaminase-like putative cysteine protease